MTAGELAPAACTLHFTSCSSISDGDVVFYINRRPPNRPQHIMCLVLQEGIPNFRKPHVGITAARNLPGLGRWSKSEGSLTEGRRGCGLAFR